MPVFFISDTLWWLVVFLALYGIWRIRKDTQQTQQWLNILNQPLAMVCVCIISFYVLITCLDSIHLQTSNAQIESLLSLILAPISSQLEQSYSEPFSAYALNKVNLITDGLTTRQHPLLNITSHLDLPAYADTAHIPSLVVKDIFKNAGIGLLLGLAISLVILLPIRQLSLNKPKWRTQKTFLSTCACLITLSTLLYWLSLDYHILGTDKVGNDVLINALKGIRTAMIIGTITTIVLLPLALITGMSAGYFLGLADDFIQYIYTTLNSIPGILLIASAVLLLQIFIQQNSDYFELTVQQADVRLVLLCAILGVTSWTGLCRLLRAETLKLRALEYVQSARAFGLSNRQIIKRHILPNLSHIVLIVIVLDFSGLVLAEAVLSYVGVGVDPTTPSWGNTINNARLEIAKQPPIWWNIGAVFLLMFTLVLAVNLLADTVKKELDPSYRSP